MMSRSALPSLSSSAPPKISLPLHRSPAQYRHVHGRRRPRDTRHNLSPRRVVQQTFHFPLTFSRSSPCSDAGCSKRCVFCCNPDSWSPAGGTHMTVAQVFRQIETSIPYYLSSGGGITLSGGECLLQPRFSKQLCVEARRRGLTAALDTAASATFNSANLPIDR